MRFTTSRTVCSISSRMPGAQLPSWSMIPAPRISPARTTRLVVVMVSHATRASGSFDRNRSTIASEIWSATLSGWPSDPDSEVNRYELRMRESRSLDVGYKESFICRPLAAAAAQHNAADDEQEAQ